MRSKAGRAPERIGDILEAISNARSDIGALDRGAFLKDGKTQRAVLESLIVMGEAANNLMRLLPELQQSHPELWRHLRDIYDMRIVLTHEYFRVDMGIVWDTLQLDIPNFESILRSYQQQMSA